jgi:hypothetical protein
MSSRFLFSLSLSSLLALASCSDDPSTIAETDNVTADDDDDDDSTALTDEDDDSKTADASKPPRMDAGRTDSGNPPDEPKADAGDPPQTTPDSGKTDAGKDDAGNPPVMGEGECCDDGDCLCHGPVPSAPTADKGPFATKNYIVRGVGCVYYPDDPEAKPPFAAVTFSHGLGGSGGCSESSFQGGGWAPLLASWGIVGMTIDTGAGDQPNVRGRKLNAAVEALKMENTKSGSPLMGKLAGRYGTSGFSMGGGGTSHATVTDKTLLSSVAVMPYGTARAGVQTPTLVICGSMDNIANCRSHGTPLYAGIPDSVPKMRVTVNDGHVGQPSADRGASGRAGLAFQKVFLEGDERWRPLLTSIMANETNIQ